MASNKKKAKRVATLFGKQKVTTTPEIAAMIKSGEIDPSTHSIKGGKFAPKRKAVVGGVGIVPTTNSANKGGMGSGAKSAGGYTAGNMDAVPGAGSMGQGSEGVPQSSVPSTDKATGQPITPSQKLQMDEQKAIKMAPFKADLEVMSTQLNEIMSGLDSDDEESVGMAKKKLETLKSALSTAKG